MSQIARIFTWETRKQVLGPKKASRASLGSALGWVLTNRWAATMAALIPTVSSAKEMGKGEPPGRAGVRAKATSALNCYAESFRAAAKPGCKVGRFTRLTLARKSTRRPMGTPQRPARRTSLPLKSSRTIASVASSTMEADGGRVAMGSRRPSVLAVFCLRGRSQAIGVVAVTWSLLVGFSYSGGAEEVTAILLAREGQVDYSKTASTNWVAATNAQRLALSERLRTLERSSAAVQLADLSVIRLRQLSILTLLAPRKTTARARLDFTAGWLYFFHRNQPREIEVQTPSVTAGIDGTEFHLEVDANQRTVLTLVDGEVEMSNPFGTLHLTSGEQGIADPGQAPRKVIGIDTLNIIQWCLYYPGVLDPDELDLTAAERTSLGPSLEAYRRGDLRGALDNLPAVGPGGSAAERTYRAGVRLSSGAETNYDACV